MNSDADFLVVEYNIIYLYKISKNNKTYPFFKDYKSI